MKGHAELKKTLNKLSDNAKKMDGTHDVSLAELFPKTFMEEYTSFTDLQEMFDLVDIDIENEALEDNVILQNTIQERTQFANWQEMLEKATVAYVERQLFKGI